MEQDRFKKNVILGIIIIVLFFIDTAIYFIGLKVRIPFICGITRSISKIIFVIYIILIVSKNVNYIKENKNIKKILKNIMLPIIIIVFIGFVLIKICDNIFNITIFNVMIYDTTDLSINSDDEYVVITNYKSLSLESDGGSNYNIYYKINLDKNYVIKMEDHYVGFCGYEYIGKVVYKKTLDDDEVLQLKELLNTIFSNIGTELLDSESEETGIIVMQKKYNFSNKENSDIEVCNESLIDEFEDIISEE